MITAQQAQSLAAENAEKCTGTEASRLMEEVEVRIYERAKLGFTDARIYAPNGTFRRQAVGIVKGMLNAAGYEIQHDEKLDMITVSWCAE